MADYEIFDTPNFSLQAGGQLPLAKLAYTTIGTKSPGDHTNFALKLTHRPLSSLRGGFPTEFTFVETPGAEACNLIAGLCPPGELCRVTSFPHD
jgi:hypothetical protein